MLASQPKLQIATDLSSKRLDFGFQRGSLIGRDGFDKAPQHGGPPLSASLQTLLLQLCLDCFNALLLQLP